MTRCAILLIFTIASAACSGKTPPVAAHVEAKLESDSGELTRRQGKTFLVSDEPLIRPESRCDYHKSEAAWVDRNRTQASRETFQTSKEFLDYQQCYKEYLESLDRAHLQRLAPVVLRGALSSVPTFRVKTSDAKKGGHQYVVQSIVTELVFDIDLAAREQQTPHQVIGLGLSQAAPYVSATSAGVLGPVSALVSNFDIITGLPTSWDSAVKRGLVGCEIRVIDVRSGKVVLSFRSAGIFRAEMKQVGKDLAGYHKRSVESSSPVDALQIALAEAAKHLKEKLP